MQHIRNFNIVDLGELYTSASLFLLRTETLLIYAWYRERETDQRRVVFFFPKPRV